MLSARFLCSLVHRRRRCFKLCTFTFEYTSLWFLCLFLPWCDLSRSFLYSDDSRYSSHCPSKVCTFDGGHFKKAIASCRPVEPYASVRLFLQAPFTKPRASFLLARVSSLSQSATFSVCWKSWSRNSSFHF